METTVDLHTHMLPGVDDGAESLNDALEMISAAASNGTTDIVLTPHYLTNDARSFGFSQPELTKRFRQFQETAARVYPDVKLYFGAEMYVSGNLDDLPDDTIIPINGTNYVLVEFGFNDTIGKSLRAVFSLIRRGYTPIIAHPERYDFVIADPESILAFYDVGALLQVNAGSLGGYHGGAAADVAMWLLERRAVCAISSDCHGMYGRSPDLSEAYLFVSSEFSIDYAEELFYQNPLAIIEGKPLSSGGHVL